MQKQTILCFGKPVQRCRARILTIQALVTFEIAWNSVHPENLLNDIYTCQVYQMIHYIYHRIAVLSTGFENGVLTLIANHIGAIMVTAYGCIILGH